MVARFLALAPAAASELAHEGHVAARVRRDGERAFFEHRYVAAGNGVDRHLHTRRVACADWLRQFTPKELSTIREGPARSRIYGIGKRGTGAIVDDRQLSLLRHLQLEEDEKRDPRRKLMRNKVFPPVLEHSVVGFDEETHRRVFRNADLHTVTTQPELSETEFELLVTAMHDKRAFLVLLLHVQWLRATCGQFRCSRGTSRWSSVGRTATSSHSTKRRLVGSSMARGIQFPTSSRTHSLRCRPSVCVGLHDCQNLFSLSCRY